MAERDLLLVIDEGTTSTRAIVFDRDFSPVSQAQLDIELFQPSDGWVEQDGEEIWSKTLQVCRDAIDGAGGIDRIAGLGLTNQRETTLIWNRTTGRPIAPAIVWQDRRTTERCEVLLRQGREPAVQARTGLLLDPYFSGTKIGWLLDHVPGARAQAEAGALAFGTVDTFLIWKLTGGAEHVTDVTNASRTLLYPLELDRGAGWSAEMLDMLDVPHAILPRVMPSSAELGMTDAALFGRSLPILSAIGDQQAALVGQACLSPGTAKITYGTGAFLVSNTGDLRPSSENRLLGTIGFDVSGGPRAYAVEGAIFNAGTVIKWLRDTLGLIASADETAGRAAALNGNGGVYLVPAFTGLGAPHWDPEARGTITGLTGATSADHIVRAGLEAAAYQTHDLLSAFEADRAPVRLLKVDGGMAANDWLMQFIADICDIPVERPDFTEMTALGAAALAGMQLGWTSPEAWEARAVSGRRFEPAIASETRQALINGWASALRRTLAV